MLYIFEISQVPTKYFKEVTLAKSRKKLKLNLLSLKCFIFLKSFQQLYLNEKVTKYLKEVNFVKYRHKLQSYICHSRCSRSLPHER